MSATAPPTTTARTTTARSSGRTTRSTGRRRPARSGCGSSSCRTPSRSAGSCSPTASSAAGARSGTTPALARAAPRHQLHRRPHLPAHLLERDDGAGARRGGRGQPQEDGDVTSRSRSSAASSSSAASTRSTSVSGAKGLTHEGPASSAHSAYASTFYLITSFHGLHVLTGVIYLTRDAASARRWASTTTATHNHIEILGLFWHFVDLVWILVFTFIYLL